MYLTDWNEHYLNKLWPGWDATLKDNDGKWKVDPPVTSIGKFEALQLSKVVAKLSKHHQCILQSQEVQNFQASKILLVL